MKSIYISLKHRQFMVISVFVILFFFLFPYSALAAPSQVYTDSETGYVVVYMSSSQVAYYTSTPFSPNGKYLVYGNCRMMNTDGTDEHTLTGPCAAGVGEYAVMGWWSNDSDYYFLPQGLYKIDVLANTISQIPNASQYLPFYFPQVSPDGKTLFGTGNSGDISNGVGTAKFVNIDGTNYRTFSSPGRQSGGFDITHGWLGNDVAWYLNNSQWELYADVPMAFNVNTGAFLGPLNVGDKTWDGVFTHPTLSPSGYCVGGGAGTIAGNGTRMSYANTKTTTNTAERQLTVISSVQGNHQNISSDGKWIVSGATSGSNAGFITVFAMPSPSSTTGSSPIRVARFKSGSVSESDEKNPSFSPDSTKIVFTNASSVTGMSMVIFQNPDTPTNLTLNTPGSQAILSWEPASQHREIKEYEIYRASSQNGSYSKVATVPALYTYLDAPSKITSSQSTISVDSTEGFPEQGMIEILGLSTELATELVSYTGKTETSFTGCTRGVRGTPPAEHYNDAFVWKYTGSGGYTETFSSGAWYKVRSVEWSGLASDYSQPVSSGSPDTTRPAPPTGLRIIQ